MPASVPFKRAGIGPSGDSMSDSDMASQGGAGALARTLTWKQGLIVAMGVPILIIPSIADVSTPMYSFSIAIWVISVLSGFFINLPLGEMCATFGVAGMGGAVQHVFEDDEKYKGKRLNKGRLIGAMGAWCYFVGWVTVIPIFSMMVANYLMTLDMFSGIGDGFARTLFYLGISLVVYIYTIGSSLKGLEGGAKLQLVLTLLTIIPIVVIAVSPMFLGQFHLDYIINDFHPASGKWDGNAMLMIIALLCVAQWSAVGWETAAAYGAEYKDPAHDVPKALILCGLVCLALYFLIPFAAYGTLGHAKIEEAGAATMVPIAILCFGDLVGTIAVLFLVIGMVVVVQTAMQGCSRTIQVMATNGHMPLFLSHTNQYGVPVKALLFEAGIGFLVIILGVTAYETLAISCPCYALSHALCQLAFLKSRRDPRFKDVERVYKCPRGFFGVSIGVVILQVCIFLPALLWYLNDTMGIVYCLMSGVLPLAYIPTWWYLQKWNHEKHPEIPNGLNYDL